MEVVLSLLDLVVVDVGVDACECIKGRWCIIQRYLCIYCYLGKELLLVLIVERRISCEQNIAHDAHGPNVHFAAVRVSSQDLGGHVVGCAARLLIGAQVFNSFGESEIGQLDVRVVVVALEQQVFRLDVAMANALVMQILHGGQENFNEITSLLLGVIRLIMVNMG